MRTNQTQTIGPSLNIMLVIIMLLPWLSPAQNSTKGNLVIVGGGLEPDNHAIFSTLISLAGGTDKATFAVIPSASGTPVQSYIYFRNILKSYGVKPDNIHLVNIAVMDDDSTLDVNEANWKNNGEDSHLADLIRNCSCVWFSGGDQLRTTKTLIRSDGTQTPVLKAVWDVYQNGGVVGGTSAGAAIMSHIMICGGNSVAALTKGVITSYNGDDFPDQDGVLVSTGLGFFPSGIVDQHFNTRARFGRTSLTLMHYRESGNYAFGVDENTALIYHAADNTMMVTGAAGVTILNASDARLTYAGKFPSIENMVVSYLEEGDSYDFSKGTITSAKGKLLNRGKEHYQSLFQGQDGLLTSGKTTFRELITEHLTDNSKNDSVEDITFISPTVGFRVSLIKTAETEAFCPEKLHHDHRYTVVNVRMDITPVHVSVTPIK